MYTAEDLIKNLNEENFYYYLENANNEDIINLFNNDIFKKQINERIFSFGIFGAARENNYKIISCVIDSFFKSCNPNKELINFFSAFNIAIRKNHIDILNCLLNNEYSSEVVFDYIESKKKYAKNIDYYRFNDEKLYEIIYSKFNKFNYFISGFLPENAEIMKYFSNANVSYEILEESMIIIMINIPDKFCNYFYNLNERHMMQLSNSESVRILLKEEMSTELGQKQEYLTILNVLDKMKLKEQLDNEIIVKNNREKITKI